MHLLIDQKLFIPIHSAEMNEILNFGKIQSPHTILIQLSVSKCCAMLVRTWSGVWDITGTRGCIGRRGRSLVTPWYTYSQERTTHSKTPENKRENEHGGSRRIHNKSFFEKTVFGKEKSFHENIIMHIALRKTCHVLVI